MFDKTPKICYFLRLLPYHYYTIFQQGGQAFFVDFYRRRRGSCIFFYFALVWGHGFWYNTSTKGKTHE